MRRDRLTVLLVAVVASCVAGSSVLLLAAKSPAAASAQINLRIGDKVAIPAIGWSCELALVQGSASFTCTPGKAGAASQGQPLVSAQWARLVIFGSKNPTLESIATPKEPLRIWTFTVVRR
jgi:hypothetical protein